jgi:hypothetical protein
MQWLHELQLRNSILYWFGWICLLGSLVSIVMMQISSVQVLGINAWIKPMKFFLSVWIFCWTMGWILFELHQPVAVYRYSIMVVIVMVIENGIIAWQAANGRLSHFNTSSALYSMLFSLMGVAIVILTVWTLIIGLRFFKLTPADIQIGYLWGIRLGILFFVIFSFEGGLMASRLSHTIGAADGSPGLPVINWSRQYGDLRVAHFFGIHSLQLLPLLGFYLARSSKEIIIVAIVYFLAVSFLFIQALRGIPLFRSCLN